MFEVVIAKWSHLELTLLIYGLRYYLFNQLTANKLFFLKQFIVTKTESEIYEFAFWYTIERNKPNPIPSIVDLFCYETLEEEDDIRSNEVITRDIPEPTPLNTVNKEQLLNETDINELISTLF